MRRTWIGVILISILLTVGCAPYCYYSRGVAHDKKGNFELAIRELSKAIELKPGWALLYVARGNAYGNKGNFYEAIKDYNKAITLDPTFAYAYTERGVTYAGNGDYERAIRDFNIAIKLDSKNASAYKNRGNAFFYQGRFALAEADYRAYLRMKPKNIYRMLWLYIAQERAGKSGLHELSDNIKKADLGKWPGPVASILLEEISPQELLEKTKDKDQRVEKQRQCEAYFYLGQYYLLKGDKEKAAQMFKLCLETKVTYYIEYTGAKVELGRMGLE
ncbi:MAG: tetratricopeptide repeat protein [Candidatus Hodarchaeota archaeon]